MKRRKKVTYRDEADIQDKGVELAVRFNRVILQTYAPGDVSVLDVAVACGSLIRGYVDQVPEPARAEVIQRIVTMIEERNTRQ